MLSLVTRLVESTICPVEISSIAVTPELTLPRKIYLVSDRLFERDTEFFMLMTPVLAPYALEFSPVLRVTSDPVEFGLLLPALGHEKYREFSAAFLVSVERLLHLIKDQLDDLRGATDYCADWQTTLQLSIHAAIDYRVAEGIGTNIDRDAFEGIAREVRRDAEGLGAVGRQ